MAEAINAIHLPKDWISSGLSVGIASLRSAISDPRGACESEPASMVLTPAKRGSLPRNLLLRRLLLRPYRLLAHCNKFLGGARVDANGLVENPLCGAGLDRDRETLGD